MADGKPSYVPRGPVGIYKALVWSLQGLRHAFAVESSFRLQAYAFVVLAAELLNSAIEALADRISPGHDPAIGHAKDMGSAAVFLLMINVLVCWALILAPRFASQAGG